MPPFKLVWRNLTRRKLRSILTIGSLAIAIFLVCGLRTIITTIRSGAETANPRRLDVMSASGLFAELPMSYQAKIAAVPGVETTTKFQWFGGYYRNTKGFFAQFAIDPETMFEMYPECKTTPDAIAELKRVRNGCIIGRTLTKDFGWKVGDTIPITGSLHPHPDDKAWEFQVVGVYHSDVPSFDNRTMFFRWDYFEETLKQGGITPGVGVYALRAAPDASIEQVIADVEDAFKDADNRIDCTTEAEFQRQFQSMFGNIPLFLGWIGGGVLIAILVAAVNTLLMSMREQTTDVGVMKSLGFTDATVFGLFLAQGLFLCIVGGGLGILAAIATQPMIAASLENMFPGYAVQPETLMLGAAITIGLGPIAGLYPAWRARNLRVIEALRGAD